MHWLRVLAPATLIVACATSARTTPSPTIFISLDSFSFAPRPLRLAAGRPTRLQFVNRSGMGHDFTAKSFFRSARMLSGAAPDGQIELRGRHAAIIELIPARGRYPVHCSHFGHKLLGMKAEIIVE